MSGCSGPIETESPVRATAPVRSELEAPPAVAVDQDAPLLVAFGDSLTAGYGLAPEESYPSVLARLLVERGFEVRVANEGVSGDTTASALARFEAVRSRNPKWVVLALGANDGLRGLSLEAMEQNLRTIAQGFRDGGAQVVVAGMKLPPNYGPEYVGDFEAIYPRLAEDLGLPLIPFLLDGVAAEQGLNQSDGIHPTAEGAAVVAGLVADAVEPLLRADSE